MTRRTLLFLAAALLGVSSRAAAQQPTVVFVVRHAERAGDPSGDPGLTPAGEARAQALAAALADAKVNALITTQYRRTQLTAAPLTQPLGLTPTIVRASGPMAAHIQAIADAVRALPGRTILVVGHSNTVPHIVTALGGPRLEDFCDNAYDDLFTIVIRPGGDVSVTRSRYGSPNGPAPADCPAG